LLGLLRSFGLRILGLSIGHYGGGGRVEEDEEREGIVVGCSVVESVYLRGRMRRRVIRKLIIYDGGRGWREWMALRRTS
jgi:hypothetical protein